MMANLFDVYNDADLIEHTEGKKLESGETPVTISGLSASTTYDKIAVAYAGKEDKTPVPSFTTDVPDNIPVTGVSLDKTTLALETGATGAVKATVTPSNATDKAYTFSSGDETIATVDNTGKITAVKAGSVDITVKAHDGGKKAKVTVTITDPVTAPTEPEAPAES